MGVQAIESTKPRENGTLARIFVAACTSQLWTGRVAEMGVEVNDAVGEVGHFERK